MKSNTGLLSVAVVALAALAGCSKQTPEHAGRRPPSSCLRVPPRRHSRSAPSSDPSLPPASVVASQPARAARETGSGCFAARLRRPANRECSRSRSASAAGLRCRELRECRRSAVEWLAAPRVGLRCGTAHAAEPSPRGACRRVRYGGRRRRRRRLAQRGAGGKRGGRAAGSAGHRAPNSSVAAIAGRFRAARSISVCTSSAAQRDRMPPTRCADRRPVGTESAVGQPRAGVGRLRPAPLQARCSSARPSGAGRRRYVQQDRCRMEARRVAGQFPARRPGHPARRQRPHDGAPAQGRARHLHAPQVLTRRPLRRPDARKAPGPIDRSKAFVRR